MGEAQPSRRRRRRGMRKRGDRLYIQAILLLGLGAVMLVLAYTNVNQYVGAFSRKLLQAEEDECIDDTTEVHVESHYPQSDLLEGMSALPLQIIVMLYLFAGLAVICDEYFEVALERISDFFKLSDDVAGATFMAAGSSAPELFASLMGVFVAKSDIGIGTIVGSAVFNVLIIIGCCAFAAEGVQLSWWPLARDSIFYCLTIVLLIICVFDGVITIGRAVACIVLYIFYIILMKFNVSLEKKVKRLHETSGDRRVPLDRQVAALCNSNVMQLLIALVIVANLVVLIIELSCVDCNKEILYMLNLSFSIIFICEFVFKIYGMGFFAYWADPANAFDGILVGLIIGEFLLAAASSSGESSGSSISNLRTVRLFRVFRVFRALRCCKLIIGTQGKIAGGSVNSLLRRKNQVQPTSPEEEIDRELEMERGIDKAEEDQPTAPIEDPVKDKDDKEKDGDDDDDEDDGPADPFEYPDTMLGKIYWGVTLPMCLLMWVTIPDCRRPMFDKWFFVTFVNSIIWIGLLSFVLIWMAEAFGTTVGIPPTVMGLTILAAGTSIPDTIASVNVARAGKGDMAVSNSIGSNVFDILVGLGLPWTISSAMGNDVVVVSDTLAISVMYLFITVALVVLSIHISNWFLTKKIGYFLFFTYAVFATATILTEYGYILSSC